MKEFMQTDRVTYNLMSFTAFKSMLIFSILLDGPKTYEEIKNIFLSQKYLNETFSIDTLRVYINSLERMGCEIIRTKKSEGSKYVLVKHPFELNITDEYAKQIIKVYKAISKTISVEDLLSITKFFKKISVGIANNELKEKILNISPLTKLNSDILISLIKSCRKKEEISLIYKSPATKTKPIDIIAEELYIKNNKVYLSGESPNYENKANLLVSRIKEVPVTKIENTISPKEKIIIGCEIYNKYIPLEENEKVISTNGDTRTIEITSDNTFRARQRILSMGPDCKVLYPEAFRQDILEILKRMREEYLG